MKGLLFVITAPSGAGKTSLIRALLGDDPQLRLSVSYTTRAPRPGERDGREYHFVDEAEFLAMLNAGAFLESALVHGHRYGTAQAVVERELREGRDLILEIDWQGAQQVRVLHPECIGVFILPPSLAELEQRMKKRGQDSADTIRSRLASARDEISHAGEFDFAIINNDFEEARRDLAAIVRAARCTGTRQFARNPRLFQLSE